MSKTQNNLKKYQKYSSQKYYLDYGEEELAGYGEVEDEDDELYNYGEEQQVSLEEKGQTVYLVIFYRKSIMSFIIKCVFRGHLFKYPFQESRLSEVRTFDSSFDSDLNPPSSSSGLDALLGSIPGRPGQDYPTFDKAPRTSFTCEDKTPGGEDILFPLSILLVHLGRNRT